MAMKPWAKHYPLKSRMELGTIKTLMSEHLLERLINTSKLSKENL